MTQRLLPQSYCKLPDAPSSAFCGGQYDKPQQEMARRRTAGLTLAESSFSPAGSAAASPGSPLRQMM